MDFGMQFFPSLGPAAIPAARYFAQCLQLSELADELGYTHIRTVEHHFHPYGGYSPNPIVFLSAVSQRTRNARLILGAILPAFNHPLKLAGEIGMLDAISNGRLEVGFARAFLPHEFARFGVSLDESKARFAEGMEQVRQLLERENVAHDGKFHSFPSTTTLPRPTQRPRPPFWVAALATPESFANAGKEGHSVMAIPLAGGKMRELIGLYREAWKSAGHAGSGKVMLAFHAFCWPDGAEARDIARAPVNAYLRALVDGAAGWMAGSASKDYPGYDQIIATLEKDTFESQLEKGGVLAGTPDEISDQLAEVQKRVGGFEIASFQLNFHDLNFEYALKSARMLAAAVMPRFAGAGLAP